MTFRSIYIIGSVSLLLGSAFGFARAAYGDCQSDMQQIQKAEEAAVADGQAAKVASDSAAASASTGVSQSVNPNAGVSSGAASNCSSILQNGMAQLAKDKAAASKPTCQTTSTDPSEIQKCNQCQQKKQKAIENISKLEGELAAGNQGCNQSKEGSDETKKQSDQGGGMPQMPQSGAGAGSGADTPALDNLKNYLEEPKTTPDPVACSKPDSYNNPDCNEKLLSECVAGSSANCPQFTFRYCTSQSSGGTGEGIGSSYCKKEVAKNFCKEEGRNLCPTCKQQMIQESEACKAKGSLCVQASTEQQLAEAKANCPSDPIFTDPKNSSASGALGGGGSSGGSGSGGSASGALPASSAAVKATEDSKDGEAKKLDTSVDGGSGGFSGYGSRNSASAESSDSPFKFGGLGSQNSNKKVGAVGGVAGAGANMLTSDIHGRTSKSIFMMSTETYLDRCNRDLVSHCGPNAN